MKLTTGHSNKYGHFGVLGVALDASDEDIRRAYYTLARACHPDKNPNNPRAAKQFQTIHQAYIFLKTAPQRRAYIQHLQSLQTTQTGQTTPTQTHAPRFKLALGGKTYTVELPKFVKTLFMTFDAIKEIFWPFAPQQKA